MSSQQEYQWGELDSSSSDDSSLLSLLVIVVAFFSLLDAGGRDEGGRVGGWNGGRAGNFPWLRRCAIDRYNCAAAFAAILGDWWCIACIVVLTKWMAGAVVVVVLFLPPSPLPPSWWEHSLTIGYLSISLPTEMCKSCVHPQKLRKKRQWPTVLFFRTAPNNTRAK